MGRTVITKSFGDWCIENGYSNLLELWDYELNKDTPFDVGYHSPKKYYFKCKRGLHTSYLKMIDRITKKQTFNLNDFCPICGSFGQHVLDNYGQDYLDIIWSDKNNFDPFNIAKGSGKKVYIKCPKGVHPDEERTIYNLTNRRVCCKKCSIEEEHIKQLRDLSGLKFGYWVVIDKNKELSKEKGITYWNCKCTCGCETIEAIPMSSLTRGLTKSCGYLRTLNSGENHPNWKGGVTSEEIKLRNSNNYHEWRDSVFKKDLYTCQCCGETGGKLNTHHILNFSEYGNLRLAITNGITLCEKCHSIKYIGSFHNIYGTYNNTPEQLEKYINSKRKESLINISFSIDEYNQGVNILKPKTREAV